MRHGPKCDDENGDVANPLPGSMLAAGSSPSLESAIAGVLDQACEDERWYLESHRIIITISSSHIIIVSSFFLLTAEIVLLAPSVASILILLCLLPSLICVGKVSTWEQ